MRINASLAVAYNVLTLLAFAWAVFNSIYVYAVLDGERSYRIETAAFILIALLLPWLRWQDADDAPFVDVTPKMALLLASGAVVFYLIVVAPLVTFPFLSDDYVFLALYRDFANVGESPQFFRPLYAVVFWLVATAGSESSLPFHILSFALHLVSAALVYKLARQIIGRAPAVLAFVMFLLNPVQAEAVLWVSGLQDVLWTFFLLCALVVYVQQRTLSLSRLFVTLAMVSCALLSKETATCFILLLPAADWLLFRFSRGPMVRVAYVAFIATLAGYLFLRSALVPIEPGFLAPPDRYFLKQLVVTPYQIFTQPWHTPAVDVPQFARLLMSVLWFALLFVALRARRSGLRVLAGPWMILASTLPIYTYFFVRSDFVASRYLYFASFGWALLVATLVAAIVSTPRVFAFVVATVILVDTTSLHMNLRPWRSAGDFVKMLTRDVAAGDSLETSAARWTGRSAAAIEYKDGIPVVHDGVYLFLNGYPQFIEWVARRQTSR